MAGLGLLPIFLPTTRRRPWPARRHSTRAEAIRTGSPPRALREIEAGTGAAERSGTERETSGVGGARDQRQKMEDEQRNSELRDAGKTETQLGTQTVTWRGTDLRNQRWREDCRATRGQERLDTHRHRGYRRKAQGRLRADTTRLPTPQEQQSRARGVPWGRGQVSWARSLGGRV